MQVGLIGTAADLTYSYTHLGNSASDISKAAKSSFVTAMKEAKHPMIVVGPGVLKRTDAKAVMRDIYDLTTAAGAYLTPFQIDHSAPYWCFACAVVSGTLEHKLELLRFWDCL